MDPLLVLEHPVPAGPAIDPHRGFIRAHDPRAPQAGRDRLDFLVKPRLGPPEQAVQRPLAKAEGEGATEQTAEALMAEGMDAAQVKGCDDNAGTKRRSFFQALGHRRHRHPAAAPTAPVQDMIARLQDRPAMAAVRRLGGDKPGRLGGQHPAAACALQAARRRRRRRILGLLSRHCAALPNYDTRSPDEIVGYDETGMWR
jgi:hypothetical protein